MPAQSGPGIDVACVQMDVAKCKDGAYARDKIKEACSHFGDVDILINNAGISSRGTVQDTAMDVYFNLFDVDFFGTIGLTKALLPVFIQRGTGSFIAVSSLQGKFTPPL